MSERDRTRNTYFCVAWESESCGGFDWYATPEAADKAYEEEKVNEFIFAPECWKAYRFNVELPSTLTPEQVTQEIDYNIEEYLAPLRSAESTTE